jgi:ribosome-associated translation inhibitor RaiA
MLVEVKADHNVRGGEDWIREVQAEVADRLARFEARITRVDVFLSDVNGAKAGIDKRCVIEAHVAGLQRLAVNEEAAQLDDAISGAALKLERMIAKHVDKRGDRKGAPSFSGDGTLEVT